MNKAVRFAKENEPELWAKQQHMIEEIQRIRAENRYEQYRSFYEAELKNRKEIEELSKQAETPRTRQQWYAQEKLLFLQPLLTQLIICIQILVVCLRIAMLLILVSFLDQDVLVRRKRFLMT